MGRYIELTLNYYKGNLFVDNYQQTCRQLSTSLLTVIGKFVDNCQQVDTM